MIARFARIGLSTKVLACMVSSDCEKVMDGFQGTRSEKLLNDILSLSARPRNAWRPHLIYDK